MSVVHSEPLAQRHELDEFDCGDEDLNAWLKQRARRNEGKFSRSFVVCDEQHRVTGYYRLSAGAVGRADVSKPLQRNAPEDVPVTILGRLAVDSTQQNQGTGTLLLQDAVLRALSASTLVGSRGVLVHAKNDRVRDYYVRFGFRIMPENSLTLMISMENIAHAVRSA